MRKHFKTCQLALGAMLIAGTAHAQISGDVVRIGVLNDQSGPYVDLAGPGSVVAAQMAADEFAGKLGGARVEIVSADHQNKPDIGSTIVRRWFDEQGVDAVADVPTSSVALSVQEVARQKQRVFLISGAASEAMSGKACSPFSIHTSDDTHALTNGTVKAAVESGADTWFFITADYAFGHLIEAQSRRIVEASGGKVLGSVKHPQNTADFAQYVLQAKASGAKAIGLANAGADTVNTIKQAGEFGVYAGGQRLVGLILFISEIHALGLKDAQGLLLTEGFYWDQNEATRTWSKAFQQKFGKVPTREQATTYATVKHYLKTIQAAKTDDAATVMKAMKAAPMELFGQTGPIRADGRFIYDLTLYQVKTPAESKGPWDYYKPIRTIAGKDAFVPADKSECPLVKAAN